MQLCQLPMPIVMNRCVVETAVGSVTSKTDGFGPESDPPHAQRKAVAATPYR